MNIYKHTGNGHYIGSAVVVIAENIQLAENIIKHYLIENGLPNEPLNISEVEKKANSIIYSQNGDY